MDTTFVNFLASQVASASFETGTSSAKEQFNIYKSILTAFAQDLQERGKVIDENTFCFQFVLGSAEDSLPSYDNISNALPMGSDDKEEDESNRVSSGDNDESLIERDDISILDEDASVPLYQRMASFLWRLFVF